MKRNHRKECSPPEQESAPTVDIQVDKVKRLVMLSLTLPYPSTGEMVISIAPRSVLIVSISDPTETAPHLNDQAGHRLLKLAQLPAIVVPEQALASFTPDGVLLTLPISSASRAAAISKQISSASKSRADPN